jgi:hypothetical protein
MDTGSAGRGIGCDSCGTDLPGNLFVRLPRLERVLYARCRRGNLPSLLPAGRFPRCRQLIGEDRRLPRKVSLLSFQTSRSGKRSNARAHLG